MKPYPLLLFVFRAFMGCGYLRIVSLTLLAREKWLVEEKRQTHSIVANEVKHKTNLSYRVLMAVEPVDHVRKHRLSTLVVLRVLAFA